MPMHIPMHVSMHMRVEMAVAQILHCRAGIADDDRLGPAVAADGAADGDRHASAPSGLGSCGGGVVASLPGSTSAASFFKQIKQKCSAAASAAG